MYKKIVFYLSLITGLFGLTSISAQDSIKIGFSLGDFSSDRWSIEAEIFTKEANSLGAEVITDYAYGEPEKQVEQSRQMIESGIKVDRKSVV